MSKNIIYIVLIIFLIIWILFSKNGYSKMNNFQENIIFEMKRDQLKYRNEIECLNNQIKVVNSENKNIILIDNKFKKKYYATLKKNKILEDKIININSLVLSYYKLDSIAAVVEYSKNR